MQGALGHDWGSTVSTSIASYWACVPTNVTYKAPKRSATTATTTSRSSLPLMLNTTRRWSTKLALQNWALMSAGVPHRALRATASQAINGALAPGCLAQNSARVDTAMICMGEFWSNIGISLRRHRFTRPESRRFRENRWGNSTAGRRTSLF